MKSRMLFKALYFGGRPLSELIALALDEGAFGMKDHLPHKNIGFCWAYVHCCWMDVRISLWALWCMPGLAGLARGCESFKRVDVNHSR